jgi:DNA-binding MarR family transcriptional regulator
MNRPEDVNATAAAVRAAVSLFTRRARESKSGELSLPERTALSRLDRNGPDTTAALARWEEISPQAMGATVAALESKGYVERARDPSDGRRAILTVTAAGSEAALATRGQLTVRLAATLDEHFTSEEMAVLRRAAPLLERLSELI